MHASPRSLAVTAVTLTVLACSLTGRAEPGTVAPTTTPPLPSPTATPEPPPPEDFGAVLDAEIAAGEVTEGEGLVRLLRAFLGDSDAGLSEAYSTAAETEGTGIIDRANEYLDHGDDEASKVEIQQLLDALIPTTDQLQAFSQPAASTGRGAGLAVSQLDVAAAPAAQTDCARLWRDGFPLDAPHVPCFEFTVGSVPGIGAWAIYYPASWAADDPGRARLDVASEAAQVAMSAYGPYGDIGPVNIIFTSFDGPPRILAEVFSRHARADEACPMLIYPRALVETDDAQFQQSVAHEMFHCFQVRHLRDQMVGTDHDIRQWWSEASAEYFSNVAYPDVNFEQRHEDSFDRNSTTTPLTQMAYENAVFFQYLADRVGNGEVLSLLQSMPEAGGEAEQLAALASFPEVQSLFHDFGRAYLESRVEDTGGGAFATNPEPGDDLQFSGDSGLPLQADPFIVRRFRVSFDDDQLFTLTNEAAGDGLNALRLGYGEGAWGPIPETLNTACPHPASTLLLTNAGAGGSVYELSIQAETSESGECDPCLIGNWQMDLDSYRAAFDALTSTYIPGGATLDELGGSITALFFDDGHVYSTTDGFTAGASFTSSGQPAHLTMIMNGTVNSIYTVTGPNQIVFLRPDEHLTTETRVTVRGVSVDVPGMELPPPGLISGEYTCTGDTLHLTPVDVGVDHPGVDFTRVP